MIHSRLTYCAHCRSVIASNALRCGYCRLLTRRGFALLGLVALVGAAGRLIATVGR